MLYKEKFQQQKQEENDAAYRQLCLLIVVVESLMLVVYFLSQQPGKPALSPAYLYFYLLAIGGAALFPLLSWLARPYQRLHNALQLVFLNALLIWACLFAACDIRNGNSSAVYAQILIFTSAVLWLPKRLHYLINAYTCVLYLVLIYTSYVSQQSFYSEVINGVIYLLISCVIINSADRFQYASFCLAEDQLRLQHNQLDMMSGQVARVQEMMEEIRIMRHDLRHYAFAVQQSLDQGNYQQIRQITTNITSTLEQTAREWPIRSYTTIADIDAILSQYALWAEQNGVDFLVELPAATMTIDVHDFSLLLLNALENSAQAIGKQPAGSPRTLKIVGDCYNGQYFLEISNSYLPGSVTIAKGRGLPIAREPGHGYGTKSMAAILRRYHAHYRFQAKEREFCFQFLVPPRDNKLK